MEVGGLTQPSSSAPCHGPARQPTLAPCRAERDAANARLSAVVPELEALEASWARLHGICGAATADDLIAYWQGGWREGQGRQGGSATVHP